MVDEEFKKQWEKNFEKVWKKNKANSLRKTLCYLHTIWSVLSKERKENPGNEKLLNYISEIECYLLQYEDDYSFQTILDEEEVLKIDD